MNKLCIHYPNKSDKETYEICTEVCVYFHIQICVNSFKILDNRKLEAI
jgi:hypothetical protein